jgi:hypothetical protein
MPDIDGYWVGISPRQGLRRAQIIAVDRRRQEAERVAIERELHPGAYALFQAARTGCSRRPAGRFPRPACALSRRPGNRCSSRWMY